MKLQTVFFSFIASVALCQNVSTGGSSLLAVLQSDPDTQGFAQLLAENPEFLANTDPARKYTVFAPSNAAVAAFRQSFGINGSLVSGLSRRALSNSAAAIQLLFTDRSFQENINRLATDLITDLSDPEFINIEPASVSASTTLSSTSIPSSSSSVESASNSAVSTTSSVESTTSSAGSTVSSLLSISSSAQPPSSSASPSESTLIPTSAPPPATSSSATPPSPPPPPPRAPVGAVVDPPVETGSASANAPFFRRQINRSLLISSGFGKESRASLSEASYESGAVRKVDSFLTLFGDLAATLQETNGTAFSDALARAGTLDSLSKTPRITVFVPSDAALQGQTLSADALKQYVLPNTLATRAGLKEGSYTTSAGDSVNVTTNADGSFSINNATIVKSDVMIKNGVVHYIDKAYTSTLVSSAPGFNIPTLAVVVAILVSSASVF